MGKGAKVKAKRACFALAGRPDNPKPNGLKGPL